MDGQLTEKLPRRFRQPLIPTAMDHVLSGSRRVELSVQGECSIGVNLGGQRNMEPSSSITLYRHCNTDWGVIACRFCSACFPGWNLYFTNEALPKGVVHQEGRVGDTALVLG
ncbi:hypothetical protein D3C85_1160150 [compost metagenome]